MLGFIDAFFVQSLLITINYKSSQSIFFLDCPGLAPFSFSLILRPLQLKYADSYILSSRTTLRKHISSIVACVSVGVPT
jgi:hypothetical protein